MKRISAVIPLHNRQTLIIETLRSVERQRRRPDEVIVVDDHSTDGSAEVVRRFAATTPLAVRLLSNDRRKGVSGATNCGIAAASGDYVALLDSDDLWIPVHLAQLERGLERFSEAGIAFSAIRVFGDAADTPVKEQEFVAAVASCLGKAFVSKGEGNWFSRPDLLCTLLEDGVPFRCQAALFRKGLFAGQLFDENIAYTQDAQFLTIAARRAAFLYVAVTGLLLRRHGGNDGDGAYEDKIAASYERRVKGLKAFFAQQRLTTAERKALKKRLVALQSDVMRVRGAAVNRAGKLVEMLRLFASVPCCRSVKTALKVAFREWPAAGASGGGHEGNPVQGNPAGSGE
jgi:glycosyltransferase involved in cell wall biosynthesis